jgi:SAM-dependent methyltransferase
MLNRIQNFSRLEARPSICEPFQNGRETGRLLHDLGAMIALLNPEMLSAPILDFGAGSGWITETISRMGQRVTAFDIHTDLAGCIEGRINADARIDASLIDYEIGDGHHMPFLDASFGHLLCYDTLHHMQDYDQVFREFFRVLKPGGRAIFVEPGARHSTSPETIEFMKMKTSDPSWIERDVVLEEIDRIARVAGLSELNIVPMQHPTKLRIFPLRKWRLFRLGNPISRFFFTKLFARTNYYDRVILFFDRPQITRMM